MAYALERGARWKMGRLLQEMPHSNETLAGQRVALHSCPLPTQIDFSDYLGDHMVALKGSQKIASASLPSA